MDTKIYIIFRDGVPYELIRGSFEFRESRVIGWGENFPNHKFTISHIGLDLLCQYED